MPKTSGVYSVDVGWALRAKLRARDEAYRMAALRDFCEHIDRRTVEEATLKMADKDRAIVLRMLDEVQPRLIAQ